MQTCLYLKLDYGYMISKSTEIRDYISTQTTYHV